MSPMKVLVIGASGKLGSAIVREALERGHEITALVRRPAAFPLKHERLKIEQGDVLERLDGAMAGKEAVICSLGIPPTLGPVTIYSEGTSNLLRCMQRHNTRRFICITGIGAGTSKGHGGLPYNRVVQPLLLRTIYEDKTRQEELVRYCDRDWVIVRPAQLTDGKPEARFGVLRDVRGVQTTSISRADVAVFCVDQLAKNKYLYQFPILTNE